jgi:hypothetical protein
MNWNEATACDVSLYAVTLRSEFRQFGQQTAELNISSVCYLETNTMKTSLGSLLASTMQAIETGFRAYFTFSERDARILASAYGFPHPEIEDLQDSRLSENVSTVSIPPKMKLPQRLTRHYRPIPPGIDPELIDLTLGAALRKRLHM